MPAILTNQQTVRACEFPPEEKNGHRLRVAVCIDTRDGPGRERVQGVYEYAAQRNWSLLLMRQDDSATIERILEMQVDGAILFDRSRDFHQQLRQHGVYCVETSSRNLDLDHAAFFVDDDAIGCVAAEHLASLELEHFGYCGLSDRPVPSGRRGASFRAHLARRGLDVESFTEFSNVGDAPIVLLRQWLQHLSKPAGILAFDDRIAERLLVACKWAGLRVPQDIVLLGVGNDELVCELVEPTLSTISVPTREIGRLAAEAIDKHSQGQSVTGAHALPPVELVARDSSERLFKPDAKVAAAIRLIRAEAHRPFGTGEIVEAVGIPRRTLERRFLASTGRTIHDFIVDVRLHLAKRLLRRAHEPLGDVARRCGYMTSSAFTRMFVGRTGCHPDEYRKRSGDLN